MEAEPTVDLLEWLRSGDDELRRRYDRLYVPRNDGRFLKRNALIALGNVGEPEHEAALEGYAAGGDELLGEHAQWALARIRERRA